MKKRTKQYFTAGTIAAMMVSSYGTGVPAMAAKVTLPRTAKVVVGAKKVLKLKNNKRAAKWKVSKGKKYVKIVKKSKKSCTVKGIKKGNATVQAVIGAKKYSCKVKVTVKAKNKVGESKRPSVSPAPEVSKRPSVSPAPEKTEIPATASTGVNDGPEGIVTIVYDGTNSDEIKDIPGKVNVIVKEGVTEIGASAFEDCSGLASITLPESVTKIGGAAFSRCSGLTSITLPESVTEIGDSAFSYCSGLTSITIPKNVTKIGSEAFLGCSGLTSITLPDSVTEIGDSAFSYCSDLTSITLPKNVTKIGRAAFENCSGLTSITLPESVTEIGSEAFYYCSGLTSITLPESVVEIGDHAFSSCDNLESIKVNENNKVYDSRENCNAIIEKSSNTLIAGCKNTKVPSGVMKIGIVIY